MEKLSIFLFWLLAVQLSFADQNGSVKAFLERVPYQVNGRDVRLAIGSSDYNRGTSSEVFLYINIDLPNDVAAMRHAEIKVTVEDSAGKKIVANPTAPLLEKSDGHQSATFKLSLEKGQKIESVRLQWEKSDKSFLYSKGQIGDIFLF